MFFLNHYFVLFFMLCSKACGQEFCLSGALTREPFLQCLQLLLNGQMSVTKSSGIASQFDVYSLFPCQISFENIAVTPTTVSRDFKLSSFLKNVCQYVEGRGE